MRKLILKMSMSLNGFVSGPNGELHWMSAKDNGAAKEWQLARAWDASLHIMGRKTFNDMKRHWPTSTDAYAAPMNSIPKAYFSTGAADAQQTNNANEEKDEGDIASWIAAPRLMGGLDSEIRKLKEGEGKPIIAWGGAGFARSLVPTGLIDEFQFLVYPVALPTGLEIFSKLDKPLNIELTALERFGSGVVAKTFHRA